MIEISDQLYSQLETNARGFAQTPSTVIQKMLLEYQEHQRQKSLIKHDKISPIKFCYRNQLHDKATLVLRVISDYVATQRESLTLNQLYQAFPNELQEGAGIALSYYEVVRRYDGETNKNFFTDEGDLLDLQDGKVAVSNDWNVISIMAFVEHAKSLGFHIEKVEHTALCSKRPIKQTDNTVLVAEKQQMHDLEMPVPKKMSDSAKTSHTSMTSKTKRAKYRYNQKQYNPAQLVLQIVTDFVNSHSGPIDLKQLAKVFPSDLQGPIGVANKLDVVLEKYQGRINHLHFTNDKYLLDLAEGKVAVSTEWRQSNTGKFIQHVRQLGYVVDVQE